MRIEELSLILKERYENAPKREQVVNIHLFGIEYGEIIKRNNYKPVEIIRLAEMNKSYNTELSKGIKLSKFVILKSTR
ncbi:MAG TPA: hypothetical protein GX708_08195 [Gallicola sp.]|jgi:hypothetical protein|nr:hypothetical protein [Gallicola sp.]